MLSINKIDNTKIIAASVNNSAKPEAMPENIKEKKEYSGNSTGVNWLTGAAAVASFAIAGIGIYRSRKNNILKISPNNPYWAKAGILSGKDVNIQQVKPAVSPLPENPGVKIIDKIIPYDETEEKLKREAEKKLRTDISEKFIAYRDNGEEIPMFAYRPDEVFYKFADPLTPDLRELDDKDFDAVMSFLADYKYNDKMRAGMDLSNVEEVNRLKKLVDEAKPLEKETIVYRGIRTQKIWDNFETLDFAKDLDDGVILKDRAFVATSRVYDDDLAQVDPVNYEGHNDCGYIMRIVLPAGTKGIDCRRCTGRTLDNGINAVYILPPDSSFEIQHVDDLHRLIYAKYILP